MNTTATTPRQIVGGTKVKTQSGLVGTVGPFIGNDRLIVNTMNEIGRVVRNEVAYDDLVLTNIAPSSFLNMTPAENRRQEFAAHERAAVATFRGAGRVYPGRVNVFAEDPWGMYASAYTDTMNPWWVLDNPTEAIATAVSSVIAGDVIAEFDPTDNMWAVVVTLNDYVVVEEFIDASTPVHEAVATVLASYRANA